ncbi:hypothetical protein P152DRAFT_447095 [Eremomyces bilateralis CBS 781.70]|uniref:Uncharacterized protein n=1 Tax=Eremomyces bilateralis CBS 781.70 TaxID=1392243 RepID=A0A6G1G9T5_9PEZI|nr:uncharacterized protein P152DRAFT_447095 [Eremomyces bilateralis CBS 781.70]KAF1814793.1 hypothetical protein P152DRAFT_447095 [Eremomyces bilateralis CBS 781.70]
MDSTYRSPKRRKSSIGNFTPTRASFMSPTKASLAKFNPDLLPPSRRSSIIRSLSQPRSSSLVPSGLADFPREISKRSRSAAKTERQSSAVERDTDQETMGREVGSLSPIRRKSMRLAEPLLMTASRRLESPRLRDVFGIAPFPVEPPAETEAEAGEHVPTAHDGDRSPPSNQHKRTSKRKRDADLVVEEATAPPPASEEIVAEMLRLELELAELRRDVRLLDEQTKRAETFLDFSFDGPEDVDALLSALCEDDEQPATPDRTAPLSMSQLLGSLFRGHAHVSQANGTIEHTEPPPSLQPIEDDNFVETMKRVTHFTFHGNLSIIPRSENPGVSEEPRLQYDISVKSPKLHLTANVRLILSLQESGGGHTFRVDKLAVPSINRWARKEIGTWIDACCSRKDVSVLFHGLESYYLHAYARGRRWIELESTFPTLLMEPVGTQIRKQFSRNRIAFCRGASVLTFIHKLDLSWAGEVRREVELALPKENPYQILSGASSTDSTESDSVNLYANMLDEHPGLLDITAEKALIFRFFQVEPDGPPEVD